MSGEITVLLQRWKEGDAEAYGELIPHVYPHLRQVAAGYLRREEANRTLEPTALVHELYLKLLQQRKADWKDRAHFYTFAAKVMRMILVDHAREKKAEKRGGDQANVPLSPELAWVNLDSDTLIDVNRVLQELEPIDARKVKLVELRYFLGCTLSECAELLDISDATVERDLALVRSWLQSRLRGNSSQP